MKEAQGIAGRILQGEILAVWIGPALGSTPLHDLCAKQCHVVSSNTLPGYGTPGVVMKIQSRTLSFLIFKDQGP